METNASGSGPWVAFLPLTKFDEATGIGQGVLAEEALDKAGEIMDYASARPEFERWSGEIAKASGEKSVGNLRAMHQKHAAGKFTKVEFDDEAKKVLVEFKVVDPVDRVKCAEGVYTGLSVGGSYVKRWDDEVVKGATRYTPRPVEGSLVDNPCMYGATFVYKKATGAEELRKFVGEEAAAIAPVQGWFCAATDHRHLGKADAASCLAKREFSTKEREAAADKGEAMPDGSYPIKNGEDLSNAIQAFGRAKNKAATKRHIMSRARALGMTDKLPESWTGKSKDSEKVDAAIDLMKGLGHVSMLACLVDQLAYIADCAEDEAENEGDESKIPESLKEEVGHLSELLVQMTEEETKELTEENEMEEMARLEQLKKEGKLSAKDRQRIKAIHSHASALMDGVVADDENEDGEDGEKTATVAEMKKAVAEAAERAGANATKLVKAVLDAALGSLPERSRLVATDPGLHTKTEDAALGKSADEIAFEKAVEKGDALALTKLALHKPKTFGQLTQAAR